MNKRLTGRAFDAMSATEKQKIIDEIEAETPEQRRDRSRPPTPAEQARFDRLAKRMRGRPKLGKGTAAVTVSVEKDLLKRVEAYAHRLGLKRSELFTLALKNILPAPAAETANKLQPPLELHAEPIRKVPRHRIRKAG